MLNKKISVVITVLNEEKTIAGLLNSLLSQTKKADEIIIVDGGSEDSTVEIINYYKKNLNTFEEIKIFRKVGNRAIGRNFGIKNSRNEIVAITDAGGFPANDWLEKITSPFKNLSVNIVSGFYKPIAKSPFQKAVAPYFLVMQDKINKNREFLPSSRSVAFKKIVWEKVPYPETFSHNEDFVWDLTLKENGFSFYFEPKAIVFWQPPQKLKTALKQIYRFALGDSQAGIKRPKIKFIYLRYFCGILFLILGLWQIVFALLILYLFWSVQKNFRYVKMIQGLYLLPIIQISSDLAILVGDFVGKLNKYNKIYD